MVLGVAGRLPPPGQFTPLLLERRRESREDRQTWRFTAVRGSCVCMVCVCVAFLVVCVIVFVCLCPGWKVAIGYGQTPVWVCVCGVFGCGCDCVCLFVCVQDGRLLLDTAKHLCVQSPTQHLSLREGALYHSMCTYIKYIQQLPYIDV